MLAAGDGVVVFAGRQGGYGNVVYVDHGGGVVTRYAHLRRIETKKDASVTAGERIGQVGSTGRATGPHLHFEVRLDGRAVDPVTAMTVAELERADPRAGQLAAFALSPEIQAAVARRRSDRKQAAATRSRPERKGRVKRAAGSVVDSPPQRASLARVSSRRMCSLAATSRGYAGERSR